MKMFSQEILSYIGAAALVFFSVILVLTILSLAIVYLILKDKGRVEKISALSSSIVFKILLFILDVSYIPSKKIVSMLGGRGDVIDVVSIEIRNMLLRPSFSATPFGERIILLPQCLRHIDCKISFNSVKGATCLKCGKCKIAEITKKAEELGYLGCYIAPGGGFVRRIIKEVKPKAVIGMGCPPEVNAGMLDVDSRGIPVQGVLLLREGCVETDVDLEDVFEVMEYGG